MTRKNTTTQFLAITLATVMVLGSLPLGFAEPMNLSDSVGITDNVTVEKSSTQKSLYKQIAFGVSENELQCQNNSHVLVLRTNGNMACVTERTSERMGWERASINGVEMQMLEKDTVYHATSSEDTIGAVKVTLSKLPKLGETATLTVEFTDRYKEFANINTQSMSEEKTQQRQELETELKRQGLFTEPATGFKAILQSNGDYVNFGELDTNKLSTLESDGNVYKYYEEIYDTNNHFDTVLSVDVTPTEEGNFFISAGIPFADMRGISLYVDATTSMPMEQYWEENPEQRPPSGFVGQMEEPEPKLPDEDDLIGTTSPNENNDETEYTDKELREFLEQNGYSEEEIAKIIESSDDVNTQAGGTINLSGRITNSLSPFSVSTDTKVFGANVCAWEFNSHDLSFQLINCVKTSSSGLYFFANVLNVDRSNDGTGLDIVFTYSTNGHYATVTDINNDLYQDQSAYYFNIPDENLFVNFSPVTSGTLEEVSVHRAFWILDAVSDAREWFDDENVNVDPVSIKWQYDAGAIIFPERSANGAYYINDVIYLDGFDSANSVTDDSPERQTQIHEWGHHLMNDEFNGWPAACSGSHSVPDPNTVGCAWKEGWAQFVPALVDDTADYEVNTEKYHNFEENYSEFTIGGITFPPVPFHNENSNGYPEGNLVEGHVAGALWDIYDEVGTASYDRRDGVNKDTLSLDHEEILNVFVKEDLTFEGFYDQWKSDYGTNAHDIMYLHYMPFANFAPVADDNTITLLQDQSTQFWITGSDADGDELSFRISNTVNDGSLRDITGQFDTSDLYEYIPDNGFYGSDYFEFIAHDGQEDSNTARVDITVIQVVPISFSTSWDSIDVLVLDFSESIDTIFSPSDFTLSQGTVTSVGTTGQNAVSSDKRYLTVSGVPAGQSITVTYVGEDLQYLGGERQLEGGESDTTPPSPLPEDPPVLDPINDVTITEGSSKTVDVDATDINGDSITYSLTSAPSFVTISGDDITIAVPNEVSTTSYSVTVRATDNDGFDEESFTIFITEDNEAPILSTIPNKTSEVLQQISFSLVATDSDRPSQTLTYSMSGAPTGATLSGTIFDWTPSASQEGSHTITFTVYDGIDSDSQNVLFTIDPLADTTAPVIEITSPTDGASITVDSLTVTGTITEPESTVTSATIQLDSETPINISNNFSETFSNLADGDHFITVTATNSANLPATKQIEFTVSTLDEVIPVITLTDPDTIQIVEYRTDPMPEPGFSATDNVDGNISDQVVVSGFDNRQVGEQIISYDVTDAAGNEAVTVTRTVKVIITFENVYDNTADYTGGVPEPFFEISNLTPQVGETINVQCQLDGPDDNVEAEYLYVMEHKVGESGSDYNELDHNFDDELTSQDYTIPAEGYYYIECRYLDGSFNFVEVAYAFITVGMD